MTKALMIALPALLVAVAVANAAPQDNPVPESDDPKELWETDSPSAASDMIGAVARGIGVLFLILVLIYALVWSLRWFMGKRTAEASVSESIQVIASTYISPKKTLTLVKVFNRAILVGVTENSINTLAELDDESGWREILSDAKKKTNGGKSFSKALSAALKAGVKGNENK